MAAYRCWAEVDLSALQANLAWIRHRVGPGVQILTVVKADAYGHGLRQIAARLMQSGTDIFGVANLAEAEAIHSVGSGWPVLMLGACLPGEIEPALRDGIMPTISTLAEAKAWARAAAKSQRRARVHVKVDTGMGRLGVPVAEAARLLEQLTRMPQLEVQGLFTHYASAEDDPAFSARQRKSFTYLLESLRARKILPPLIHANNSAALLHEPDSTFNLVRPGLLVYGVLPPGSRRAETLLKRRLQPALALKCRVSLVREVPKGTSLSYGGTFVTPRRMRVATLTAGYADGFPRAAGNRAEVLIQGKRCRVIGRVTMDQTLVDVSRLPRARSNDEAVLIGRQGREEITATELAAHCDTVPWEILTGITYRVPRLYRGGHAA